MFIWHEFYDINVVGMSIEKLFDMWRNDEILKYYVICAAVSALSWLSQFCTSKNRFRENSKIRHFVISSHCFYWHADHIYQTIYPKNQCLRLWQNGLSSFQERDTKLEWFYLTKINTIEPLSIDIVPRSAELIFNVKNFWTILF